METVITPIGPKARFLNMDNVYAGKTVNQLEHMWSEGILVGLPADLETIETFTGDSGWTVERLGQLRKRTQGANVENFGVDTKCMLDAADSDLDSRVDPGQETVVELDLCLLGIGQDLGLNHGM